MKIISFNVWDLPLFFVRNRKSRFEGLLKYLEKSDADIVCLQEAFDVDHRERLIERFKDKYNHIGDADSRKILFTKVFDKTGGLMILSKFPVKFKRFVPYSRIFNFAVGEIFARKGFLEAILETPTGDLRVINTHLHEETPFFDRSVRLSQLRKIFNEIEDKDLPTVLMGDLNQHSIVHQKDFAECFDSFGLHHPLRHEPHLPTYRPENIYVDSWINRTKIPKRFDYIMVKSLNSLGLEAEHYRPEHLEVELSDHDPLVLLLSSKKNIDV